MHLSKSGGGSDHDVIEASDDLGKRSQANDDQGPVDDTDALRWSLERLALRCQRPDVVDNLSGRRLSGDGRRKGHNGGEEVAE